MSLKNSAQPVSPLVLHTVYHLNDPEDIIPSRRIVPVKAVPPRLVIRIKEARPSCYRNYYRKIQSTAHKNVPCPTYFKNLMLQAQPEGSHEVNSPYRPNTLEHARKRTLDPELIVIESSFSRGSLFDSYYPY